MSEPPALLLGHGPGATPPEAAALSSALAPSAAGSQQARRWWLDATLSVTLLAEPGARFADAAAASAWARRVWAHLDGAEAASPDAVAGRGNDAVAWASGPRLRGGSRGVTLLAPGHDPAAWQALAAAAGAQVAAIAPLWAGVLAAWQRSLGPGQPAVTRLVVAEGRTLTLLDLHDGTLQSFASAGLASADAAGLATLASKADVQTVWLAGHSLPGDLPAGWQAVPALGAPSQAPAALLAALDQVLGKTAVEPAFLPHRALSPRVARLFAGTAALVLAVAGFEAWQADAALAEARQQAAARSQAAPRPQRAPAEAAAQERLGQPWAERFAVAEATTPQGGHWLRLEQRRDQARMLLAGSVAEPSGAFAVAQRLAALPGVAEAAVMRSEGRGGDRAAGAADGRSEARDSGARFEIGVALRADAPEGSR